MSTFYFGSMCGHIAAHHQDRDQVSDRDRQAVTASLAGHARAGRLDMDEYEARVARASTATSRQELEAAVGDVERLESILSPRRRATVPSLGVVLAVLIGGLVLAALAFGLHPAFLWVVPLVAFKAARFHRFARHGRHSWHSGRAEETIAA